MKKLRNIGPLNTQPHVALAKISHHLLTVGETVAVSEMTAVNAVIIIKVKTLTMSSNSDVACESQGLNSYICYGNNYWIVSKKMLDAELFLFGLTCPVSCAAGVLSSQRPQ